MSMQMASTKAQIVDPAVGYVNSHVVERKHSPIPKRNSLPTLDFLEPGSTVRLKFHQKTTIKNNNNSVKTNNLGSLLIPNDKTMRRPVEPCRLPHLVTQWQYNTNSVGIEAQRPCRPWNMDALRKLYVFGDAEQRAGADKAIDDIWVCRNGCVRSDDPRRRHFDGPTRHHCRGAARVGTAEIPCRDFVDTTRRSAATY